MKRLTDLLCPPEPGNQSSVSRVCRRPLKKSVAALILLTLSATAGPALAGGESHREERPFRLGLIAGLTFGTRNAPDVGVYTTGGAIAWPIDPIYKLTNLETEISIKKFTYLVEYEDAGVSSDISNTTYSADAIATKHLIGGIRYKLRAGLGALAMQNITETGTPGNTTFRTESKTIYALNLGAGVQKNFEDFFICLETTYPLPTDQIDSIGAIKLQVNLQTGLFF